MINPDRTADYIEAVDFARAGLKTGDFIKIHLGHDSEHGRYIEVQTDQGWCPYPFWQENEQPEDPAHYN